MLKNYHQADHDFRGHSLKKLKQLKIEIKERKKTSHSRLVIVISGVIHN